MISQIIFVFLIYNIITLNSCTKAGTTCLRMITEEHYKMNQVLSF